MNVIPKGQLSLFELEVDENAKIPLKNTMIDLFPMDATMDAMEQVNYLKKGEKLLDLLRRKKVDTKKPVKTFFYKGFNARTYLGKDFWEKRKYLFDTIAKNLIRPVMCRVHDEGVEVLKEILPQVIYEKITIVAENSYADRLGGMFFRQKKNKEYKGMLCLSYDEDIIYYHRLYGKNTVFIPYGKNTVLTERQHMNRWHISRMEEWCVLADAARLFYMPILYRLLHRQLWSQMNGRIREWLCQKQREKISEKFETGTVVVSQTAWNIPFIKNYLEEEMYEVIMSEDERKEEHCLNTGDFIPLYFLQEKEDDTFVTEMFHPDMFFAPRFFSELLILAYEEYEEDCLKYKYEKQLATDYAKSFQTKKNIPNKIVHAMETSEFNRFFGYVEFDEDVDLNKMEEICREWKAISELFHFEYQNEVSLRFRRLGHHLAAGLYYPVYKCICVDLKNPYSMFHEYMHMYDFENGELSRSADFVAVRSMYKERLRDAVKEHGIILKGKYNMSYYCEATEIFARCGELYITHCLGVDNSLVNANGFAYPDDEDMIEQIRNYFDPLFHLNSRSVNVDSIAG